MAKKEESGEKVPTIRRGRIDSLSVYEITDYELDILQRGTEGSTAFNFAIFFLSVAISFLATLLSTDIPAGKVYSTFVIVTVTGFALGPVLLVAWFRSRKSVSEVVRKIKRRMPLDTVLIEQGESPVGK